VFSWVELFEMANITYTHLWTHRLELGDVTRMLTQQPEGVAANGELVEGICLPSSRLLVAASAHDKGNVATYARLASYIQEHYPGVLFSAMLDSGTVFEAQLATGDKLHSFTITDVSVPFGRRIVSLNVSVDSESRYGTTLRTLVDGEIKKNLPAARTTHVDERLFHRLQKFLEHETDR